MIFFLFFGIGGWVDFDVLVIFFIVCFRCKFYSYIDCLFYYMVIKVLQ